LPELWNKSFSGAEILPRVRIRLLISMTFITLAVLWGFLVESQRKKPVSTQLNERQHLTPAEETAKMLSAPNLEMASSVTEHTTARLGEKLKTPIEKPQSS